VPFAASLAAGNGGMRMEERVAIVTGASSGIGAASARMLAERGVRVIVNYAGNASGADEVVAACRAAGAEAEAVQGDVADDAACRAIATAATERWGRIDTLVNNAGTTVSADARDLDALDADDFRRLYDVNVIGAYQMTRAALPALRSGGQGSVVMTSSIAGITGMGSSVAYSCSKGALNTMTLALARSLAPQVRVNAVCPGFVDSAWWARRHDEATIDKMRARSASAALLRRTAPSEEVAEAVVLFAIGSRSITGQLLAVDNGMTLNIGQPLADAHER
jgi:3-oxoacyl-[acyl-carrier protein] reductase